MLDDSFPIILIPASCIIGIIFASWLWQRCAGHSAGPTVTGKRSVGPRFDLARGNCQRRVAQINMGSSQSVIRGANGREYLLEEEQRGEEEVRVCRQQARGVFGLSLLLLRERSRSRIGGHLLKCRRRNSSPQVIAKAAEIQEAISEGAVSFLTTEYKVRESRRGAGRSRHG